MFVRPATSALKGVGRSKHSSVATQICATRWFSASTSHSVRALFSKTENEELNQMFDTAQKNIILPAFLPPEQRRVVFDPKQTAFLEQNPIETEVEGYEHRFSTIDPHKDIPDARRHLGLITKLMRSREDFENLPTLLAGYRRAGIKLKQNSYSTVMGRASRAGQIPAALECVKQAKHTGCYISAVDQLVILTNALTDYAAKAEGNVEEIERAVKWAELVIDILQRPEHVKHNGSSGSPAQDLHNSPIARANMLYLRAALLQAKQDAGQEVAKDLVVLQDEIKLVRTVWKPIAYRDLSTVKEFAVLIPPFGPGVKSKSKYTDTPALSKVNYIEALAGVIRGLEGALRAVPDAEPETASLFRQVTENVESHLNEQMQSAPERNPRWLERYQEIVGRPIGNTASQSGEPQISEN